jgi:ABC-type uncharacterized transport system involved in gliding motility auxiliary subunit
MDPRPSHRWQMRLRNGLFVLLLGIVVAILARLSHTYNVQADWTAGNRNTLSDSSRELVKRLKGPVEITAFAAYDAELYDSIRKRIARYQRYKKDLSLEFVNPELAPERARQAGVTRSGQIMVVLGERTEKLDDLSERSLTNALARLSRDKPRLALVLEGHGERDPFDPSERGMSQIREVLTRSGLSVDRLNLIRSPAIPENADLLALFAPQKAVSEGELAPIRTWLEKGGNLLWLDDPGESVGLESLAKAIGVDFLPGVVVDANQELRMLLGIQHPAIVPVVDYGRHPVTQGLELQTLFPFAVAIESGKGDAASDWSYQPLLTTLSRAWSETGNLDGEIRYEDAKGDRIGPLRLGVALTREKDGREQRIVVIGDSDFMANGGLGRGANLDLSVNIFNWLARDEGLIAISPKTAPDANLELPTAAAFVLGLGFLFVLPAGLIIVGMVIWLRRRRR